LLPPRQQCRGVFAFLQCEMIHTTRIAGCGPSGASGDIACLPFDPADDLPILQSYDKRHARLITK
jgi:hypothetical protein